jgi:hypothetical protein
MGLFHRVASLARGRALTHRALVQHVPLGKPFFHAVSPDGVGVNVFAPVDPGPLPGCVVDNHHVRVPINSVRLVVGDVQVIEFMPKPESVIREQAAAIAK